MVVRVYVLNQVVDSEQGLLEPLSASRHKRDACQPVSAQWHRSSLGYCGMAGEMGMIKKKTEHDDQRCRVNRTLCVLEGRGQTGKVLKQNVHLVLLVVLKCTSYPINFGNLGTLFISLMMFVKTCVEVQNDMPWSDTVVVCLLAQEWSY